MPSNLRRFQETKGVHFVTFSCNERKPLLRHPEVRQVFENALEQVRVWYGITINAYVVMPEHVHLLLHEPDRKKLSRALQILKQMVARKLSKGDGEPFWFPRYFDRNVSSVEEFENVRAYIHANPVKRGLCHRPEDWAWSSFNHHATGKEGTVEIESQWTARKRERNGALPIAVWRPPNK